MSKVPLFRLHKQCDISNLGYQRSTSTDGSIVHVISMTLAAVSLFADIINSQLTKAIKISGHNFGVVLSARVPISPSWLLWNQKAKHKLPGFSTFEPFVVPGGPSAHLGYFRTKSISQVTNRLNTKKMKVTLTYKSSSEINPG